ncbi:hypothetical protein BSKO_02185 [Bryopsis sp. KO-2023]|nr:hypothetical protein BSKO_02185 [Bryopsis sp. KO-2023]
MFNASFLRSTRLYRHSFLAERRAAGVCRGLITKPTNDKFKVLFCGSEMPDSFRYTKEELRNDPNIEVSFCERAEVAENIRDADCIIPLMARIDERLLETGRNLKLIMQYGVGLEGVDSHKALQMGIRVANIPGHGTGNAMSCAEHALYLTLALLRDQNGMRASLENRVLGAPTGEMLAGKTVMIIGFGGIAQQLIPILRPFRVRMICLRRRDWAQGQWTQHARDVSKMVAVKTRWADFHMHAQKVDIIILTCTQNSESYRMVNQNFLDKCRPGIRIVNVARGGLLDYDAVRSALEDGQIGGLGLDVQWSEPFDPNDPIAKHPKVVLTPHIAGVTETSYRNMAKVVAEQVRRVAAGLAPSKSITCR